MADWSSLRLKEQQLEEALIRAIQAGMNHWSYHDKYSLSAEDIALLDAAGYLDRSRPGAVFSLTEKAFKLGDAAYKRRYRPKR